MEFNQNIQLNCASEQITHIPIANFVSEIKFGCLMRLLKRFCLTYSAALAPPCPKIEKEKINDKNQLCSIQDPTLVP